MSHWRWTVMVGMVLALAGGWLPAYAASADSFQQGMEAYRFGEYHAATGYFQSVTQAQPSSGAYVNLGLAEWRRGRVGEAIQAWEQAVWIDPYDHAARDNLAYARQMTALAAPDYSWYERASRWLPINAWAWIAGMSLWLAVGMVVLPGVFRWRRAAWQQAVAALALAVFFICLPAHYGVLTRTQIGFALQKSVPLRLTPTAGAEVLMKLSAGEPVRAIRERNEYVLVRTADGQGWIERSQFGRVCPK